MMEKGSGLAMLELQTVSGNLGTTAKETSKVLTLTTGSNTEKDKLLGIPKDHNRASIR